MTEIARGVQSSWRGSAFTWKPPLFRLQPSYNTLSYRIAAHISQEGAIHEEISGNRSPCVLDSQPLAWLESFRANPRPGRHPGAGKCPGIVRTGVTDVAPRHSGKEKEVDCGEPAHDRTRSR